jgi:hypothetical protein
MALREIIGDLIEEFEPTGSSIRMHEAIKAGRPRVLADREATIMLIDEGIQRHLKNTSTRSLGGGRASRRSCGGDDPRQTNMFQVFGLKPRYALDDEEKNVKRTDWLTRAELRKLIRIREGQLIADGNHLEMLRTAEETVGPLWDEHPDLSFGQVTELYLRSRKEAA